MIDLEKLQDEIKEIIEDEISGILRSNYSKVSIDEVAKTITDLVMRRCDVPDAAVIRIATQAIEIKRLKEKLRWIPVTERLPEKTSWTMVRQGMAIGMCMFSNGKFYDPTYAPCFNINISEITHWREIPELEAGE